MSGQIKEGYGSEGCGENDLSQVQRDFDLGAAGQREVGAGEEGDSEIGCVQERLFKLARSFFIGFLQSTIHSTETCLEEHIACLAL